MHPFKRLPWYPLLFPTLRSHPRIFDLTKVLQSLFHEDWILFPVAIGSLMDWRGPGGQAKDPMAYPMGRPPSPQKRPVLVNVLLQNPWKVGGIYVLKKEMDVIWIWTNHQSFRGIS